MRRKSLFKLVAVLPVLIICVCLLMPTAFTQGVPLFISGHVTVNGVATGGVRVSVGSHDVYTDGSGFYQYCPSIANGSSVTVTAYYNGHQASRTVQQTGQGGVTVDLAISYSTTSPTPTPPPSGGGGGAGETITLPPESNMIPVKNSLGTIIGYITTLPGNNIRLSVGQNITVNGQEVFLSVEAKLNDVPSDPRLDIVGETPDTSKLPSGITLKDILAQFNLTRFSNGWDVQHGSLKITVKMPKALAENADLSKSMLVRYDGTSYELLYPSAAGPDANGTITFTVVSPNEAFKYNGFSEYILTTSLLPTPTPTPVPTASPTPTPTGGLEPLTILLALILVVVVVGAFVIYFWMQRRQ